MAIFQNMFSDREQAEDLVQDVFLRCMDGAGVDEKQKQALIDGFNESVQGLEDAESCA